MNEWARLVDRYASELKKYELVCSFCGQHLADVNINNDCHENLGGAVNAGAKGATTKTDVVVVAYFTDETPPNEIINTKRHFFGRPSLKGYK
jgi:hypothetical protein